MGTSCLPFCLRRKQFKSQPSKLSNEDIKEQDEKKSISKSNSSKTISSKTNSSKTYSSCRGGSFSNNFLLFTELRRKIMTFRDIFDMPQLDASIPIHELVISTAEDIHRMYPDFVAKVTDKVDGRNIHQGLVCFYEVLKCIGDSDWINSEARNNLKHENVEQATLEELVKIEVVILDHINKVAKAKFDSIKKGKQEERDREEEEEDDDDDDEEEEVKRDESPKSMCIDASSLGHSPDWKYPPPSSSPQTPTSVLPESPYEENNGKCSSFEGLKLQPMDKENPMDWKRISFQMILQNNAQNQTKGNTVGVEGGIRYQASMVDEKIQAGGTSEDEDYESPVLKSETPTEGSNDAKIDNISSTHFQVKSQELNDDVKVDEPSPGLAQAQSNGVNELKIDELSPGLAQAPADVVNELKIDELSPGLAQAPADVVMVEKPDKVSPGLVHDQSKVGDLSPLKNIQPIETKHSPQQPKIPPPQVAPPPSNSPTTSLQRTTTPPPQNPTRSSPRITTLKVAPPSSPSHSSTRTSPRITTPQGPPPPSPPPSPKTPTRPSPRKTTSDDAPPPSPPPPPNSPTHQSPSRRSSKARPPPPPPIPGSGPPPLPGGSLPPPPPPPGGNKGGEQISPSMPKGKGGAPPPPPRSLRAKMTTKLKRSTQMANLYRFLKGKVEGSSIPNQSGQPKKSTSSNGRGGGQSMADALAEMTKRSSYFQQIEEDVEKHGSEIKEMQTSLSSFETKDMEELLRFHQNVESKLEVLTDESQILSRFDDFPVKKLEALRMAAALYTKLSGILTELRKWKIESPLEQLLDKVEKYFTKVKGELEPLERTKDEEAKKLRNHNIHFDFQIMLKIKESMVDVSSSCIELALKERREALAASTDQAWSKPGSQKHVCAKMLWRAFKFAFKVYSFAGGQDDRADHLARELAQEIEKDPVNG